MVEEVTVYLKCFTNALPTTMANGIKLVVSLPVVGKEGNNFLKHVWRSDAVY